MTPVEKLLEIAEALGPDVIQLSRHVLHNPDFAIWTGSGRQGSHHYGDGLLAQHTLEVVEVAMENNNYYSRLGKAVCPKLLFLAGIFHDIGKLKDYERGFDEKGYPIWKDAEHKYEIHHISSSAITWNQVVSETANAGLLTQDEIAQVTHAILAHHGLRAWGSPVEPRTRLAWLLHFSDNLSAHMDVPKFEKPKK